VENLWKTCGKPVENLWKTCGKPVENSLKIPPLTTPYNI